MTRGYLHFSLRAFVVVLVSSFPSFLLFFYSSFLLLIFSFCRRNSMKTMRWCCAKCTTSRRASSSSTSTSSCMLSAAAAAAPPLASRRRRDSRLRHTAIHPRRYHEIVDFHMENNDYEQVISSCKKYGYLRGHEPTTQPRARHVTHTHRLLSHGTKKGRWIRTCGSRP